MCTLQEHTQRWADEKRIQGPTFVVVQERPGVARIKVQPAGIVEELTSILYRLLETTELNLDEMEIETEYAIADAQYVLAKARGEVAA